MSRLRTLVAEELGTEVDPRVAAMAEAIARKHSPASRAVLFYGSCLREQTLDGLMLDFYLIVSDYRSAYGRRLPAAANRLVPPNVFHLEHHGLRAKYAVLSEPHFARECGPGAFTVSTAARFAQPSRLAWARDCGSESAVVDAVTKAAPALLGWTLPLVPNADGEEMFRRAFELTYGAELRAERSSRPSAIVDTDPERYRRFALAALAETGPAGRSGKQARRWWRRMQRRGKWYSVPRIAKAALTFAGGVDYVAWKINRHAGTDIRIKPWQRRWPLLAALSLLPRLLKSGAVR